MRLSIPLAIALAHTFTAAYSESIEPIDTVTISGDWLGTGFQNSLQKFAGSRTVMSKSDIEDSGAANIEDALRHIPGVQITDNSSSGGSTMSLNMGVRGLDGRFSPRSTVLMDGIPLAVAPYGQPQLSFAPISLGNINSIDVVRGGGAVRYGPQNVGGIINFNTRPIPAQAFTGDATLRYNDNNRQYNAFLGGQNENGLGAALLLSGSDGSDWREHSQARVRDLALKARYAINDHAELFGKLGYFDAHTEVPGGLNAAQYADNPWQSQRTHDYWQGHRGSAELGYLNELSRNSEVEIKSYFNHSVRESGLANNFDGSATSINLQPRDYNVFGIEPRLTQRRQFGAWQHDITLGYRYLQESSNEISVDQSLSSGATTLRRSSSNNSNAHSAYIDDQIVWHQWRFIPGLRVESVNIRRSSNGETYHQPLPALGVAYIVSPALTVFTNYNTSFASVQFLELNLQSAGNQLQAEVAKTVELGARWKKDGLKWDATLFDLRFNNQIEYVNQNYINQGKTYHRGVETSVQYDWENGWSTYATYAYTKATLESGAQVGHDLPFYARNVDTQGIRYQRNQWTINLSTTHQTGQYADDANTFAENAAGTSGWIPGYRLWNAQIDWKSKDGLGLSAGVNNFTNTSYFTRTTDTNAGKLAGAPRSVYVQLRTTF